jgi:hypothetical protein
MAYERKKESIGSIHEVTLEGIDWLEDGWGRVCFSSTFALEGACALVVVLVLGIITHHPRISLLTYHPRGLVTFRPLLLCLHRSCSNQHNYPLDHLIDCLRAHHSLSTSLHDLTQGW